ncbi:hypothetical protein MHU86_19468 [Fragilaria crotonensis]|nr:hypothetical protein MHU86_19468 [Fragilaria crotonensis]
MAALNRPTEATYVVHDRVTVETTDNEDHTFCGVMFPVKCKDNLPLDHVIINSIAVRGRLGPITVWVSNEQRRPDPQYFAMNPRYWTKIYEKTHRPSFQTFQTLDLSQNPIVMKPGQVRAIYVHSTLPGDEAIVYDNRHHRRTYDDALVSILTGRAHVSQTPFGTTPIWGWGNPWRDQREFVGRIQYGAVYKLWNPSEAHVFGGKFQSLARCLFLCQRRWESPMSMLPDDCIFYILNMCRWDWANDTPQDMRALKKRRALRQVAAAVEPAAAAAPSPAAAAAAPLTAAKSAPTTCCTRVCTAAASDGEEDDDDDEEEEEESDDSDVEFQEAREEEDKDDDDDEDDDEDDDDEYVWNDDAGADEDVDVDDDDDEESDEEDDTDEDWGASRNENDVFRYQDDSDEESADGSRDTAHYRQAWIRRQFARIHVLHALTQLEDNAVVDHGA